MPTTGVRPEISDSKEHISDKAAPNVPSVSTGTLLLSFKLTIGRLAFAGRELRTNEAIAALSILDESGIAKEYLYWYLKSFDWEAIAVGDHKVKGKTLNKKKIASLPIRIPCRADQHRIVAKLDRAFAEIDRAIENTERGMREASNALVQFLDSVFSGPNSLAWERKTVSEIADHKLGKMLDKNKNRGEFQPYLRNLNVRWFEFDLEDVLEMKVEEREHERYSVLPGDLMICEGGYPGRCAIWNEDQPMYFQKAIHRVRPYDARYTAWLQYWLFYLDSTDQLRQHFTGAGIQHFTGKALAALPVPVPPQEQAAELCHQADAIREEVAALRAVQQQRLTALRALKQSILAETFSFPEDASA
jgi:type I restriction enzyme, S subunit